jgi:pimeloyl-ACP methyl ester carboxylesterase
VLVPSLALPPAPARSRPSSKPCSLLPRIRTPTLVLHRRGDRAVRIEAGRHLGDPGSRFVALDGNDHWLWAGEQSAALEQIRNFLSQLLTDVRNSPRCGVPLCDGIS